MGSLTLSVESKRALLADWQSIYDRHRFLDAYNASSEYWTESTSIDELTAADSVAGRTTQVAVLARVLKAGDGVRRSHGDRVRPLRTLGITVVDPIDVVGAGERVAIACAAEKVGKLT
jgi:hypothetical protein